MKRRALKSRRLYTIMENYEKIKALGKLPNNPKNNMELDITTRMMDATIASYVKEESKLARQLLKLEKV